MSHCEDVCEAVCDRLSGAGFDVPGDVSLGPDGHDEVLEMLACTVIIPAQFTLPEDARLLPYPHVDQLRIAVEERIAEVVRDYSLQLPSFGISPKLEDAEVYELARLLFVEAAALLRPDLFDKAPQAVVADDEEE